MARQFPVFPQRADHNRCPRSPLNFTYRWLFSWESSDAKLRTTKSTPSFFYELSWCMCIYIYIYVHFLALSQNCEKQSFVVSVCPFTSNKSAPNGKTFMKFDIRIFFKNLSTILVSLKPDKSDGHLT